MLAASKYQSALLYDVQPAKYLFALALKAPTDRIKVFQRKPVSARDFPGVIGANSA